MRTRHPSAGRALAGALSAALFTACSGSGEPPPPPAESAPTSLLAQAASVGIVASAVAPTFGGKVAVAGPAVVELMPRTDGLVLAEVRDASGAAVQSGTVSVRLTGVDGEARTLPLRYDSDLQVFEGNLGVALPPAPANVEVTVQATGAQPSVVTLSQVPVAPVPAYGGQVVLVGSLAPEVRWDADGSVHAYLPDGHTRLPSGQLYVNISADASAAQRVPFEYVEAERHYVAQLAPTARPARGVLNVEFEVEGRVERGRTVHAVVVAPPRLGGTVVVAGDYGIEVAPVEGELHATIADSSGVYVSAPPPSVEVYVVGRPAPVVMRWDVTRNVYVAPLPPRVNFEVDPFRVELRHNGRRHRGAVRVHARGRGPRAQVVVPAPSARVEVVGPPPPSGRVDVRVQGPQPQGSVRVVGGPPVPARVDVRVEAPRPPSVNVRVNAPAPPSGSVRVTAPAPSGSVRVTAPAPSGSVRVQSNNGVGDMRGGGRDSNRGRDDDRGRRR